MCPYKVMVKWLFLFWRSALYNQQINAFKPITISKSVVKLEKCGINVALTLLIFKEWEKGIYYRICNPFRGKQKFHVADCMLHTLGINSKACLRECGGRVRIRKGKMGIKVF